MDAHDEDQGRILEALQTGYMVLVDQHNERSYLELGEGRRVRQEWQQAEARACLTAQITVGIIEYEDLAGHPSAIRSDDISSMWEASARGRAAARFLSDTLEEERRSHSKWNDDT